MVETSDNPLNGDIEPGTLDVIDYHGPNATIIARMVAKLEFAGMTGLIGVPDTRKQLRLKLMQANLMPAEQKRKEHQKLRAFVGEEAIRAHVNSELTQLGIGSVEMADIVRHLDLSIENMPGWEEAVEYGRKNFGMVIEEAEVINRRENVSDDLCCMILVLNKVKELAAIDDTRTRNQKIDEWNTQVVPVLFKDRSPEDIDKFKLTSLKVRSYRISKPLPLSKQRIDQSNTLSYQEMETILPAVNNNLRRLAYQVVKGTLSQDEALQMARHLDRASEFHALMTKINNVIEDRRRKNS